MRAFIFALTILSTTLYAAQPSHAETPAKEKKPAPAEKADEFPLPKDASAPNDAPGGGGKIKSYTVPRGKDVVLAELRDALKKGGWAVTKDDTSPRGAVRLEVKKGDKTWKVSVLGEPTKTAIVLTLP